MVIVIILIIILILIYIVCKCREHFSDEGLKFKAPPSFTIIKSSDGVDTGNTEGGVGEVMDRLAKLTSKYRSSEIKDGNILNFPSHFNCRDEWPGCLPDPLYQGNCGSCWAFAAVTCLSSRFYIESCGTTGCMNYPQINQKALDYTLQNLDTVYKFKKVSLDNMDNMLDKDGNGEITKKEWVDTVLDAHHTVLFNTRERYNALQLIIYLLDFQSMGSIDFSRKNYNLGKIRERAGKTFEKWSKGGRIVVKEWKERMLQKPLMLSAEKLISCCSPDCFDPNKSLYKSTNIENNPQCDGGTLIDAWKMLRNLGTTSSLCVGYNLDDWRVGEPTKNCKEQLGPRYSYCSGYILNVEEWDENLDEIINKSEESGLEPIYYLRRGEEKIKIPPNKNTTPWMNPNLFTFRAKNAYEVQDDMESIQREIIERGPVTTGFYVYEDFQYEFGTKGMGGQSFKEPLGGSKDSLIYYHSPKEGEEPLGGHAITVTGWGEYQGIPYWICLNSWGDGWGHSGYPRWDSRGGVPERMDGGGYFWFVRGINNCGFEKNVVAGQPNLSNISYPGILEKYGWGLPFPKEYDLIDEENVIESGGVTVNIDNSIFKEGTGSYVDMVSKDNWEFKSGGLPSPYTLFWPEERPRFVISTLTKDVGRKGDTMELGSTENLTNFKTPILVLGGEQIQLIRVLDKRSIKVVRSINGVSNGHKKGTVVTIIPYRNITIDDLSFLEKAEPVYGV